jgi:predicted phage terminase large subunit-like protein
MSDITDAELLKLKDSVRLKAGDHHLNFMSYTWTNRSKPFVIGYHTQQICACIDYAIEKFRQGKSTYWVITVPFRHGKAIRIDTPIFTSTGWKSHGELKPGDLVFGDDGFTHRVIANTGVYEWDTVKITFNHGEEIICAREHLWKVTQFIDNRKGRAKIKVGSEYIKRIVETQNIGLPIKKRGNRPPFIEITRPLQLPEQKLPIDPYTLGIWLGDGEEKGARVIKHTDDVKHIYKKILPHYPDSIIENISGKENCKMIRIQGMLKHLNETNLTNNKHIPENYLLASEPQRWALVQGLMDTDGYADKRGLCEFSQVSKTIAEDFLSLIRSLGIRATIGEYDAKLYGRIVGKKYRVCFTPKKDMPVFTLPRKLERIENKTMQDGIEKDRFYIKSIEPNGKALVNCIQVEGGIYLVGRELIPTHNSEIISRKLPAHFLGLFPDRNVILCGHTTALTEGFSKTSRNLIRTKAFRELFPHVEVDPRSSSGAHWRIKNREGECFSSGLLGSLSGQGYHLGILDDFCRNRADAESPTMREKMWDAFTNDFMTRGAEVSITIVLATPWHVDDIIGRIKQSQDTDLEFPRFNFLKFPAISDRYPEGILFPQMFDKKWYSQRRAILGEYGFQSLMQLDPKRRGGNILNTDCIVRHQSVSEYPKNLQWYRIWDLAHTAKQRKKQNPDFTSGTLLAFQIQENMIHMYIKDVVRMRENAPERDAKIRLIAKQDGPYTKIGVGDSVDAKDAIATLRKVLKSKRIVYSVPENRDKVVRVTPLEPIFQAGNVHVPMNAPWHKDWIEEVEAFPFGSHDDQVDNLSCGYALWDSQGVTDSLYVM